MDRLRRVDQFAGCTTEQLHDVVRLAERVEVGEGEILTREGRIGQEILPHPRGVKMTQIGFLEFWEFLWRERTSSWRFLKWTGEMERYAHPKPKNL